MEVALTLTLTGSSAGVCTWGDIATAISNVTGLSTSAGLASLSFAKMRITSVVADPLWANPGPGVAEVAFATSGNRFQYSDRNKLLRMKLSPEYNGDGAWIPKPVITHTAAGVVTITKGNLPPEATVGNFDITDTEFLRVLIVGSNAISSEEAGIGIHFRIAWTDAANVD